MADNTLFGDYATTKARGRHISKCHRCSYASRPKFYPGHAELAVRQHIKDTHKIDNPKQDARQTWLKS